MKLALPVENPRDAFCTRGCHSSFYRRRCVVCEGEMVRKTEHQLICGKRRCRNALQAGQNLGRYAAPSGSVSAPRNIDSTGTKTGLEPERPWHIAAGPKISASNYHCASLPMDPETAKRAAAANNPERIRQEIEWRPRRLHHHADVTAQSRWQPSWRPQWPLSDDDLSIPEFLRRVPS
jgi:hypothetical protein